MLLLEVFLELFIEYMIKSLSPHVKQKWAQRQLPASRSFVTSVDVVNRDNEQRAINAAITASDMKSRVIHFYGPGGCGKTRLLEESERIFHQHRRKYQLRYGQIIDLYHADLHSISAMQNVIVQTLDPDEEYFSHYREARDRFEDRRGQGVADTILNIERKRLNDLFLEDYSEMAQIVRPILRFDTVETLQRESDLIQDLCQLNNSYPVEGYDWLVQYSGLLPNSVILLAGRPETSLLQELRRTHQITPGSYEEIEIGGLSRTDSQELLTRYLNQTSTSLANSLEANSDRLWEITKGLPVQLAIIVEILVQIESDAEIFSHLPANPSTWEQEIIQQIFNYDNEFTRILFFLAISRKGLTADLLHYLEPEWPYETCEERLVQLTDLSIIKKRDDAHCTRLFLHDVLYEIFDNSTRSASELLPWYERLVNYHRDHQINFREHHSEWESATVNLLYYELQQNPYIAFYESYLHWSELAIKGNKIGLDLQLRDELLRFFRASPHVYAKKDQKLSQAEIDRDSAVRWIKRLLIQAQYQQAKQVAESILKYGPYASYAVGSPSIDATYLLQEQAIDTFNIGDSFFWGHLLTYYGETLAYTGISESQTRSVLEQAIDLLENTDQNRTPNWLHQRILGRAYNTLAYLQDSYGHHGAALNAFFQALNYFKSPDLIDEQADTLNNRAFLLAKLGDYPKAKQDADLALKLRQQSGQIYPIALSYNTRGLIYALQGDFDWGERECKLAYEKFSEIEAYRGIGLSCNALGFILRNKGKKVKAEGYSIEQTSVVFQQAQDYLLQALSIFNYSSYPAAPPSSTVDEPIRLWEAYNELGSLHNEWAELYKQQNKLLQTKTYYHSSLDFQRQALAVAQTYGLHWQLADTYDDLAKLYAGWGNFEEAKRQIQYGMQIFAEQYESDLPPPLEHPAGEAYWQVLGKTHLQLGLWQLGNSENTKYDRNEGVEHLIRATFYFNRYWLTISSPSVHQKNVCEYLMKFSVSTSELHQQIKKIAGQLGSTEEELLELFKEIIEETE